MKKIYKNLVLLGTFILLSQLVFSQGGGSGDVHEKKPTIMVVPSLVWCNKNGFVTKFDNQGDQITLPNYSAAFLNSTDLKLVISKINEMMAERGFPLKNLESCLKTLKSEAAEDGLMTSKSGAEANESPIDKLKKVVSHNIPKKVESKPNSTHNLLLLA